MIPLICPAMRQAFIDEAKRKQDIYAAQRLCHTDMMRLEIQAAREYEVIWQRIVCDFHQEWSAKHG
jgi:hypothetical protein